MSETEVKLRRGEKGDRKKFIIRIREAKLVKVPKKYNLFYKIN